ncbi:hypothetical protein [uncultured Enterococcus sp.]|nr:hypothetical protein [uncultured Enterococcus sp.]
MIVEEKKRREWLRTKFFKEPIRDDSYKTMTIMKSKLFNSIFIGRF